MGTIVLLVILLLITLAGGAALIFGGSDKSERYSDDSISVRAIGGIAFGVGLVLFALVWVISSFTVVRAYEVGVPVTFGNVGEKPLEAGVHWVAPWTGVEKYPIRPLTVPDIKGKNRTNQGGSITTTVGARWSVIKEDARELYFQTRSGDLDNITATIVDKNLGQAVGNVYSQLDNSQGVSDRVGTEAKILAETQRLVDPYGIRINQVFLRDAEPDAKTADSIARLASQERATQIAIEAQKTAAANKVTRLIDAEGIRAAAAQLRGLTPEQLAGLCLNAWQTQQQAATDAHVPMYTSPCGSTGLPVTVSAK